MEIGYEDIKLLLPQKFPFLMVDRVVSLEKGRRAVAIKNITANEIYFLGHFPNMAVMPGALIIESMAQTAIILFRKTNEDTELLGQDSKTVYVFGGANARFLKPVVPGDQLYIEVTVLKAISVGGVVEAIATVAGEKVARASLSFGVKRLEDFRKARTKAHLQFER
jgi:3-hydroxyacyl-[acyl-carrier-protein] dehydratase